LRFSREPFSHLVVVPSGTQLNAGERRYKTLYVIRFH
jgi:hypothetical protein